LQRVVFDKESGFSEKIEKPVEFPEVLYLDRFGSFS
jgi:hypothetical protein